MFEVLCSVVSTPTLTRVGLFHGMSCNHIMAIKGCDERKCNTIYNSSDAVSQYLIQSSFWKLGPPKHDLEIRAARLIQWYHNY